MTIQTTRWSPDTCSCVFEYTWDDSVPADQRVHTFSNDLGNCTDHSNISGIDRYNQALLDNQTKNQMIAYVMQQNPTIVQTLADGSQKLIDGISIAWSFSGKNGSRVLSTSISGYILPLLQKTSAQGYADSTFGNGKVLIT